MNKQLTKEEKRRAVRDKIYDLCENHKDLTEFTFVSLKKHFKFNDFKEILLDLVEQKIIFKKHTKFYFYIPNDEVGKRAIERFEYNLGRYHWIDQFMLAMFSIMTLIIASIILAAKYPWLLNKILQSQTTRTDSFAFGIMYGSMFAFFLYIIYDRTLMWINSLEIRKAVYWFIGIFMTMLIGLVLWKGGSTQINSIVTVLGILTGIVALFKEQVIAFLNKLMKK